MDVSQVMKQIKSGQYNPIYIVYGKDQYRIEQFIDYFKRQLFTEDELELGVVRFDTQETPLEEMVLEAESPPFFVEKKLILVRDSSILSAASGKEAKLEHKQEVLMKYLEHPLQSSILLFHVQAEKLDERKKIVKFLKDRQCIVPFPELDAAQLKQWMMKRASSQNRVLKEDAAELVVSRIGNHLQSISSEIDKLCLHVGEQGIITVELVHQLTTATVEEDVFALVDACALLQIDRALTIYHQLLIRKEEPIKLIALIARQLRMMIQIKELESHHYSPQQIASHLSLHPYVVKLSSEKARAFQMGTLSRLLASLAELDYGMKTGQIDKALGLELYILSLGSQYEMNFKR